MNTLSSLGFSLLINQPTRIFHYEGSNTVSCSTIDHLITNADQSFTKTGVLIADVSDHLPIFGLMSLSRIRKKQFQNMYRRFFHDSKKEKFLQVLQLNLQKYDLDKLDPNSLTDRILLCIKDAINEIFPLRKVSRKEARKLQKSWMTKEILEEQSNRDKLKKRWIKLGHIIDSPEHTAYKASRNKVVGMIRQAKRKKSLKRCEDANGDSEKIWKVIRDATNTKPKPNITPDFIKVRATDG